MVAMPSDVSPGAPVAGHRRARGRRTPPAGRLRLAAVALVASCGVALAGCGGQAQEVRDALEYTGSVNRVQTAFERDLGELRRAADRAEVPDDVARAVARFSRSIDGVQADLRRIDPPASVVTLHRELIVAFGRWSVPLDRLRRALRTERTTRALRRARDSFVRDTSSVEGGLTRAAQRINDRLRSLSD